MPRAERDLEHIYRSIDAPMSDAALAWYPEVLKLWQSVEDQTAFSDNGRPRRNR